MHQIPLRHFHHPFIERVPKTPCNGNNHCFLHLVANNHTLHLASFHTQCVNPFSKATRQRKKPCESETPRKRKQTRRSPTCERTQAGHSSPSTDPILEITIPTTAYRQRLRKQRGICNKIHSRGNTGHTWWPRRRIEEIPGNRSRGIGPHNPRFHRLFGNSLASSKYTASMFVGGSIESRTKVSSGLRPRERLRFQKCFLQVPRPFVGTSTGSNKTHEPSPNTPSINVLPTIPATAPGDFHHAF